MFSTYQKGQIAQIKVELRAYEKGVVVSRPTIEARYDLILDVSGRLWRAQVKHAQRSRNGSAYNVDLRKQTRNHKRRREQATYTTDEIDVLMVYLPGLEEVLWVGPEVFAGGAKHLSFRTKPCLNKQKNGIRLAAEFIW